MKRNKKQSVDKYLYPAYKMGWDMVSWVLAQKVSEILGHEVRCVARWEDTTWALSLWDIVSRLQKLRR